MAATLTLPGDPSPRTKRERMLRVDHAGEFGAKHIYAGQLDALTHDEVATAEIEEMKAQEEEHLAVFSDLLNKHRVRPSALSPFWHVGGYLLGKLPAKLSTEAAMAVTVAVEDTIEEHYNQQIEELTDEDADLRPTLTRIRDEEVAHKHIAIEHDAEKAMAYPVLYHGVRAACKVAISIAKRV